VSQAPRRDLSVPLPVGIRCGDGSQRHEYLVNVSTTGLCLHVQTPLPVGEGVRVAFRLPSDEVLIEADCKVVWTSHGGEPPPFVRFFETGLYLSEISEEHRQRLDVFVETQVDRR
jgi:hypothetical protein